MKAAVLMVGASLALTACGNMLAPTGDQLARLEKTGAIIVWMPKSGIFLEGTMAEGAMCARGSGVGTCYLPTVEFHDGTRRIADCIIYNTSVETQADLDFLATCAESARIGREQERYAGGDMKPPDPEPAPEPEPAAPPSATSSDAGAASPDGPPQAGQCDPSDYTKEWPREECK